MYNHLSCDCHILPNSFEFQAQPEFFYWHHCECPCPIPDSVIMLIKAI